MLEYNQSLSVANMSTLRGHTVMVGYCPKGLHSSLFAQIRAAVFSQNTGPIEQ